MIEQIFIQQHANGKLEPENRDLFDEFSARGYQVTLFTEKMLMRNKVPINHNSLVAGDIPIVIAALKKLSRPIPLPDDYPESLNSFLHRRVWQTRLSTIYQQIESPAFQPVFIKPKQHLKRFTGIIVESYHDLSPLTNISRQTIVRCSEVVQWLSEYRIFVINNQIVGIRHYCGDTTMELNLTIVNTAIDQLTQSGQAHAAYGIDFGILANNETALIELNDGFSLGAYGLPRSVYTDLILTRWQQLLSI